MDVSPVTQSSSPTPIVPVQQSPAVQDIVLQGTITSIDTVSQKLEVRSSTGAVQSFMMGTTTPITHHFTPIGFNDLHVGDRGRDSLRVLALRDQQRRQAVILPFDKKPPT